MLLSCHYAISGGETALIEAFQIVSHGLPRAFKNEGRRKPNRSPVKRQRHLCSEASDLQLYSRQERPTSIKGFKMDWERTLSVFPVVYLNPLGTKTAKAE